MHPLMLKTITMGANLKSKVKSDLKSFLYGRRYFQQLGRARRQSFLLNGPSCTGKSCLVAVVAKFLNYEVYDVDLSKLHGDCDLKLLLLEKTPKSMVIVEKLDQFATEKSSKSESASSSLVTVSASGI